MCQSSVFTKTKVAASLLQNNKSGNVFREKHLYTTPFVTVLRKYNLQDKDKDIDRRETKMN